MTTQHSQTAVLIAGAGPVGLTLALKLQMSGVPYRIVEKNAGPSTATKALAVHSRTLEIFRELGIAEDAVNAGHKIERFRVQSKGRNVLLYNFELLDAAYPFLLSLPQPVTESLLLKRLQALGGKVEWGTELVELTQDTEQAHATLKSANGIEEVRAHWVAGCDGARSFVRRSLGLSFDGDSYHRYFMLTDADLEWTADRAEGAFYLGAQEGYIAVAPMDGNGRYRLFVEMPTDLPPEDQRLPLDLPTFQKLADGRGQSMKLSNLSSMTAAAFQHRRVDRLRVGRLFLLGDAAHIGSPIGGQYMNLGLSEAYNLAWKLTYVEQGLATDKLLDSYNAERLPVALQAEKTAHVLTKLLTLRDRKLVKLRDTLIPRISGLPKTQRKLPWMISGHKYNYRGSESVQDARSKKEHRRNTLRGLRSSAAFGVPRAGDLAPDLALWQRRGESEHRLIDRLSGRYSLLLFTGGDEAGPLLALHAQLARQLAARFPTLRPQLVMDALEVPPQPGDVAVLLDPDWRLHKAYGAREGLLVLVRPDGYIGYVGHDGGELLRHLQTRAQLLPAAAPAATATRRATASEIVA